MVRLDLKPGALETPLIVSYSNVHGIMDGEVVDDMVSLDNRAEEFVLR
jgi:hypothetical protein